MKAKEYLQQLQRLDTVIKQKVNELEDLRMHSKSLGGTDYSRERVQASHSGEAPFSNAIVKAIDFEEEINREIDKFSSEKHLIINQIHALHNSKYIKILYKHYVEFKRLEVIAVEMNYTYQYILELHGFALRCFQTTYKNLLNSYKPI